MAGRAERCSGRRAERSGVGASPAPENGSGRRLRGPAGRVGGSPEPRSQSRPVCRRRTAALVPRAAAVKAGVSRRAAAEAKRRALTVASTTRPVFCDGGRGAPRAQRRPVLRPQPPEGDPADMRPKSATTGFCLVLGRAGRGARESLPDSSRRRRREGDITPALCLAERGEPEGTAVAAFPSCRSLPSQVQPTCLEATSDKAPYRTRRARRLPRGDAATPLLTALPRGRVGRAGDGRAQRGQWRAARAASRGPKDRGASTPTHRLSLPGWFRSSGWWISHRRRLARGLPRSVQDA